MEQTLTAAFKKSGYNVTSESVEQRLNQLLQTLDKTAQWCAQHYEVFLSSRLVLAINCSHPAEMIPGESKVEISGVEGCANTCLMV